MTLEELQKKHDHFVSRTAAMMQAQQDYFADRKRGYAAGDRLTKAKALEAEVIKLVKAEREAKKTQQGNFF